MMVSAQETAPAPSGDAYTPPSDAYLTEAFSRARFSPWTRRERVWRALWMLARATLFRMSWHNWYGWRRFLLRAFGARVGQHCIIRPSAHVEIPWLLDLGDYSSIGDHAIIYNLGQVTIGKRVTVSQYAHLCAGTHDSTRADMPLLRPGITIGNDAWIATDAFVGPGVNVGDGALLGARASAFKDLAPWMVHVGNPARAIKRRELH